MKRKRRPAAVSAFSEGELHVETIRLHSEFTSHLQDVHILRHWLDQLYQYEEFSSGPQQQVLGLLGTAAEYLDVNLTQLRDRLPQK